MRAWVIVGLVIVLLHGPVFSADLTEETRAVVAHVEAERYEQALLSIERLKGAVYDELQKQKPPQLTEVEYINPYFEFSLRNPIQEWELFDLAVKDEIYNKRNRIMRGLVGIKNRAVPDERLSVSVYDIAQTTDGAAVAAPNFESEKYLKRLAQQFLDSRSGNDITLIEKHALPFHSYPAYFVRAEVDLGFDQYLTVMNLYLLNTSRKYVLMFSFSMMKENYAVYRHLFDEVLDYVKIGAQYDSQPVVLQKSFMAIYFQRSQEVDSDA